MQGQENDWSLDATLDAVAPRAGQLPRYSLNAISVGFDLERRVYSPKRGGAGKTPSLPDSRLTPACSSKRRAARPPMSTSLAPYSLLSSRSIPSPLSPIPSCDPGRPRSLTRYLRAPVRFSSSALDLLLDCAQPLQWSSNRASSKSTPLPFLR